MSKIILKGKIEGGSIVFKEPQTAKFNLMALESLDIEVEVRKAVKKRTESQNRALHLWFTQMAHALNEAGFDVRTVLKKDFEIPWNPELFKELIWRPVQKAYLSKSSTTRIKTKDIDILYDIINKNLGEKTGIHVPFPSAELQMEEVNNQIYENN